MSSSLCLRKPCSCFSAASVWPGSPERSPVAFHFKLTDLAEKLLLHSQASVKEFSELLLEMTPPLQAKLLSNFDTGQIPPLIQAAPSKT